MHYAERDIEEQGQVYCDHVSAMTSEKLFDKSAIAAELAHRDIRIAALKSELAGLRGKVREFVDDTGITFDDSRLRYIELQTDRESWDKLRQDAQEGK